MIDRIAFYFRQGFEANYSREIDETANGDILIQLMNPCRFGWMLKEEKSIRKQYRTKIDTDGLKLRQSNKFREKKDGK